MLIALDSNSQRITPSPGQRAVCPCCKSEVNAKCGEVNAWHWAHLPDAALQRNCVHFSAWAARWKSLVSPAQCEIQDGEFRIDILDRFRHPIILRDTTPDVAEIAAYERQYPQMLWLIDGSEFHDNCNFRERDYGHSFRWKWPRQSYFRAFRAMFWDFGDWVFEVKKLHPNVPCGGWGRFLRPEAFINNRFPALAQTA
jgi:hypothetical protein